MKDVTIVDKYMEAEAVSQISSVTYPRIEKVDFESAIKQYKENKDCKSLEYKALLNGKRAYDAWKRLKKIKKQGDDRNV